MFEIEVDHVQVCTCKISDEDEQLIREYIKDNPEKFEFMSDEKAIIEAVSELDIDEYCEQCSTSEELKEFSTALFKQINNEI